MESKVLGALKDRELELGPLPGAAVTWLHWRLTKDEDGVAWLLFDRKGVNVNSLSEEAITELGAVLSAIESDRPKGLVIRSAKPSGFIAGADINEFRGAANPELVQAAIERAHAVVDRLEALDIPTIAIIHGFCLGAGLELALACKWRIAIDGARLGFPEVMLGLHPGLGGTARSTHLINPLQAMTMMLTGKTIDARKAKSLGLVDAVTQERHVRNAVKAAISGKLKSKRPGLKSASLNTAPIRRIAARRMRVQAEQKAPHDHYPAPYALIDLWEGHGGSRAAMMAAETQSFARLAVSSTAQNLIRIFFLREQMKKGAEKPHDVHHIHVIGAGAMGGDIAAWCAFQGLRVTFADMKPEPIAGALKRAADLYQKICRKQIEIRDVLDRLIPDLNGDGLRKADIVIEAVPEKIEIKQKVYAEIEPQLKHGAILATNTSSIPLDELCSTLKAPEQFVGLHFFNPVSRMQLVEVVSQQGISPDVLAAAQGFVRQIDRLPLAVKSAPGFLVNRALTPYMLEAMLLLDEKVSAETIDGAAERFGMPVGPIELADRVGLDICFDVAEALRAKLGGPLPAVPDWLPRKLQAGELGQKTGKGIYEWKDGKPVKAGNKVAPENEMIDRLILPMVNVCVACLREGIVDDPDMIDGAMVFGTGFAPFRGGPLHYAKTRGIQDVTIAQRELAKKFGERFLPDAGWDRLSLR
jgi:3-hydroxyacyl-CoA dehydrogenase / enoyl-CoA hydratase / 3-hydroxybutyryl-CoA epimerase